MSMDISGVAGSSGLHAMSGASGGLPPQQKMANLFDSIDSSGSGSITRAQFEQAFQNRNPPAVFQAQGADAVYAALDPNGTGSVSRQDFVSTMSGLMASLRTENAAPAGSAPSDTLAASLQGLNQLDPTSVPPNGPPGSLFDLTA